MKDNFTKNTVQKDTKDSTLDSILNRYLRDRERANELVSNSEYILWLEKFTVEHPIFSSDQWLYAPEELSKEDFANVELLSLFLEGIDNYAGRNFLTLIPSDLGDDWGHHVFIKFNNVGYDIGVEHGQGSYNYCERIDISSDKHFIDFNDIMSNKKQDHVDSITAKLNDLSNLLDDMLASGVPETKISSIVESAIEKYKDTQ